MKPPGISRSSLTINHIWRVRGRRPTIRRTCKVFIPKDLRELDLLRVPACYEEDSFLIRKLKTITRHKLHHWLLVAAITIYLYTGAIMFQYIEANYGQKSPAYNLSQPRNYFLERILNISIESDEQEFASIVRELLIIHEEKVLEASLLGYTGETVISERPHWSMEAAIIYCFTVITTVGYGNIAPSTDAGRAATIVYAFLGIPLMLMVLADLGKLFTKAIKFIYRYVRRFYKTRTFNKKKAEAIFNQDKPLQYMTVSWRTVSQKSNTASRTKKAETDDPAECNQVTTLTLHNDYLYKDIDLMNVHEANHKHVEVEDEFNLPVTLAITLVLVYMVIGAALFATWEGWTFFEAFYFVFISMSTVGFGDYVPRHQSYLMGAFIYLLLGLTLTSMCINVIQEKLSATFQKAKVRIGNTIGLDVNMLLGNEHEKARSVRSNPSELGKSEDLGSKITFHKDSTCGLPTRSPTPSSPGDGRRSAASKASIDSVLPGKDILLSVPLENRFTFYDSPYSTIQNDI